MRRSPVNPKRPVGRPRVLDGATTIRVVVSAEQLTRYREAAGVEPLSSWVRRTLDVALDGDPGEPKANKERTQ